MNDLSEQKKIRSSQSTKGDPFWDERPPLTDEEYEREKGILWGYALAIVAGMLLIAGYVVGRGLGWWG
jgi:hypothetical protein